MGPQRGPDADRDTAADDREYSMTEVGTAFLADVLGHRPGPDHVEGFVAAYLAEWNTAVRYPPGVAELVHAGVAPVLRL